MSRLREISSSIHFDEAHRPRVKLNLWTQGILISATLTKSASDSRQKRSIGSLPDMPQARKDTLGNGASEEGQGERLLMMKGFFSGCSASFTAT